MESVAEQKVRGSCDACSKPTTTERYLKSYRLCETCAEAVLTAEALLYNKYADGSGNLPKTSPYADEAKDIPSLVFGALCGGIARLKHAKGLFEEATPEHDQWQDLEKAFWNTFQPFYAEALVDGVLIVKRQRQSMGARYDRETGIIESIEIDVFDQDVKPEEVRGLYEEMLNSGNLRHNRSYTGQLRRSTPRAYA